MSNLVTFLKSNGINTNVGKFEFIRAIGEGGNSFVYLFKKNEKNFVIKFLKLGSNENKIKRFQDEYFSLAQIPEKRGIISQYHLDKVTIADQNKIEEYYIIISKHYDMNLAKYRDSIYLKLEDKNQNIVYEKIFNQLLSSLIALYENKIIHRDIKPENIFIEIDKEDLSKINIILGDFGIAHFDNELYSKESHTETNERLGNRDFSAPEQSRKGEEISYSSDIFAFGQILFWLKYGRPFKGIDYIANDGIIDEVMQLCLRQNPEERFKNAKSIYDLNNINKNNFIWYMNLDEGDSHLTSILKSPFTEDMHVLKVGDDLYEINILDVTLFRDNNDPFNNLIFIRTKQASPFVYMDKFDEIKTREINKDKDLDYASYIDGKCIDPEETKNAYYKNKNGSSIHISELEHYDVKRQLKPFLYVIAPKETALNDWLSDGGASKILSKIMASEVINDKDIKNFLSHIQQSSRNYKDNKLFR